LINCDCISLDCPQEWQESLRGIRHTFAHTWESCYAMYLTTGLRTFLFKFEAEDVKIVCPIAERKFRGYTDIVTPYGISGFVGNGTCKDFPDYWKKWAEDMGYICSYIILNPLLTDKSYFRPEEAFKQKSLYVLDLRLEENRLFENLHENRKRHLRAWGQRSVTFITDRKILTSFVLKQYPAFVQRINASGVYHLSQETIKFLCGLDSIRMVGACRPEGIEAVSIFSFTPYLGDFLFNVPLEGGRHHGVDLIWWGVKSLKALQVPFLNLGGGIVEDDGVARFKQFFGAHRILFRCLKEVYQPELYKELCQLAGVDPDDRRGYFPSYRKV